MGCPTATGDVRTHRFRHAFHGLGGGELPLPAVGAPVVSAEHFSGTQHGEYGFQPHVLESGLTAAGTGHACLDWSRLAEKFGQTRCSGGV